MGLPKDPSGRFHPTARRPIKLTMARVEAPAQGARRSIRRQTTQTSLNNYLAGHWRGARERAYPIGELHAVLEIVEQHLRDLLCDHPHRRWSETLGFALVDADDGFGAHDSYSKTYLLLAQKQIPRKKGER